MEDSLRPACLTCSQSLSTRQGSYSQCHGPPGRLAYWLEPGTQLGSVGVRLRSHKSETKTPSQRSGARNEKSTHQIQRKIHRAKSKSKSNQGWEPGRLQRLKSRCSQEEETSCWGKSCSETGEQCVVQQGSLKVAPEAEGRG